MCRDDRECTGVGLIAVTIGLRAVVETALELTKLPSNPDTIPNLNISPAQPNTCPVQPDDPRHPGSSIYRSTTTIVPMIPPPVKEAAKPNGEIPPLVPGGTVLPDRMYRGGEGERIPISEERVSAKFVESWLWFVSLYKLRIRIRSDWAEREVAAGEWIEKEEAHARYSEVYELFRNTSAEDALVCQMSLLDLVLSWTWTMSSFVPEERSSRNDNTARPSMMAEYLRIPKPISFH